MIQRIFKWLTTCLRNIITRPREELDRWQRAARFFYDLARYGAQQLRHDRASQMAGALAFRSLFALLPVFIVGMIVIKAVRGTDSFLDSAQQLFISLNLDDVRVLSATQSLPTSTEPSITLAEWLHSLLSQAASVNLAAVGWVGVAVIGYAAVSLIATIENSFNTIYRAPEGRPWTRRTPIYWFVLTVSPVAIGIMWYCNNRAAEWIESMHAGQNLLVAGGILWNLFVTWLLLATTYALLPNTTVGLRHAMGGAFVAAILLQVGIHTLNIYLENAFAIGQLYGSLGLVPLFMFWIYLMWLAVLFGLEVSATLQALGGRQLDEMEQRSRISGLIDPAAILQVMEIVADRFQKGQPSNVRQVAADGHLPESVVAIMFRRLVQEQILHQVGSTETAVTLALPPDQVDAEHLIQIGFQLVDEGRSGSSRQLLTSLREVQRHLVAQTTLASLITANEPQKQNL